MICISPIEDVERVKQLYIKQDITFGEKSSAVAAVFGEEILGFCLFDIDEKGILIHDISPREDIMLADGILRSALHVAAQRSAMDARYADTAPEELFEKLDFIIDKNEKKLNIDKLFGGCGCKK